MVCYAGVGQSQRGLSDRVQIDREKSTFLCTLVAEDVLRS